MSPPKVEAPGAEGNGSQAQGEEAADVEILDDAEGVRKLRSHLAARLALMGRELHAMDAGGFIVVGGGAVAHLGDLGAVKRYVAGLGVVR